MNRDRRGSRVSSFFLHVFCVLFLAVAWLGPDLWRYVMEERRGWFFLVLGEAAVIIGLLWIR